MIVRFLIPGEPVGKGRPKFVRATGRTYTPEKTARYENLVKLEYERQSNGVYFNKTPLGVSITAMFIPPKSTSQKAAAKMLRGSLRPCKKPDADNIAKAVCDALNKVAYDDDSQIVELTVRKKYAEMEGVEVELRDICP